MEPIECDSAMENTSSLATEDAAYPQERSDIEPLCPLLSFGVPVRNAEEFLPRLLDSLLAQDFQDFEVVISDNASDDRTAEICQEYVQRDPRFRYHRNPENIGQTPNYNKALQLARGKYFRWIGCDDWLETDYARRCVEVLETHPEFIGVSTYYDLIEDNGRRNYYEYTGERLDSPLTHVRFRRVVWSMTADYRFMDPVYMMVHREVFLKIGGHKAVLSSDRVLSAELSLSGRFAHIPLCLAHRRLEDYSKLPKGGLERRYFIGEQCQKVIEQTFFDTAILFWTYVKAAPISNWEKCLCLFPIVRFLLIEGRHDSYRRIRALGSPLKRKFLSFSKGYNAST